MGTPLGTGLPSLACCLVPREEGGRSTSGLFRFLMAELAEKLMRKSVRRGRDWYSLGRCCLERSRWFGRLMAGDRNTPERV